jgi:hypothetical protein
MLDRTLLIFTANRKNSSIESSRVTRLEGILVNPSKMNQTTEAIEDGKTFNVGIRISA